jgi:hypothetical protein
MKNEKGYVLVLALMMLVVFSLISMSALETSIYEARLAGNQYRDRQAFHAADGGWAAFAGSFGTAVVDNNADNVDWRLFLSHSQLLAEQMGFDPGNSNHVFFPTQLAAPFVCIAKHEVDQDGKVKDLGNGMREYVVESHGYDAMEGRAHKIIQVSLRSRPDLDVPTALYSKSHIEVKGTSTKIQGRDQCGNNDKPGIITMLDVGIDGSPLIDGITPKVEYSPLSLPLEEMLAFYCSYADHSYKYSSDVTLTRESWGSLTGGRGEPLSPVDPLKVVYFDMGDKTVKLTGGTQGAGLLLVKGNLEINGRFSWYGYIIITGSLSYTGGGEQLITGAVLSGKATSLDSITIGGNAVIEYCGKVADDLKKRISPMKRLGWREVF